MNKENNLTIFYFFRLYNFLIVECKDCLEKIFKERIHIESEGQIQWKSVGGYGVYLSSRIPSKVLTIEQKKVVDTGILEKYDVELLSTILQNFNYSKIDKSKLDYENKKILQIKLYYNKIIILKQSKEYELDENVFNNYYSQLKETVSNLESNINLELIKVEKEKSLLDENEGSKFKDMGNVYFGKKDYNNAIISYKKGLELSNISVNLRSVLYINKCIANIEYYKQMFWNPEKESKFENKYLQLLLDSKQDSINSITIRYDWFKSWYRLGQSFEIMGEYSFSLKCYNTALYLDPNQNEVKQSVENLNKKINQQCYKSNGERDYRKEAQNYVDGFKFSDFGNKDNYKNITLSNSDFKSRYDKEIKEKTISGELLEYRAIEIEGTKLYEQCQYSKAFKCFEKAASQGLIHSMTILSLFYYYGPAWQVLPKRNERIYYSLVYQATLMKNLAPVKCQDKVLSKYFNTQYTMPNFLLASKFFRGLGSDIDFNRGIYYFERSCENNEVEGLFEYGGLLCQGPTPYYDKVKKDYERGIRLLEKAKNFGHSGAAAAYGQVLRDRFNQNGVLNISKNQNPLKKEDFSKQWESIKLYLGSEQFVEGVSSKLYQRYINEECSIDYFNSFARIHQYAKDGSKLASKLVNSITLLRKYIENLESNDKPTVSTIEPLAKILMSSESYIANQLTLKQKGKTMEILNQLYEHNFINKYVHIVYCGLNIINEYSNKNEIVYRANFAIEKLIPNDLDLIYQRALLYLYSSQIDKSLQDFKFIIEKDPNYHNSLVYFHIADTHIYFNVEQRNKTALQVIDHYKQYLERNPDCIRLSYVHHAISQLYILMDIYDKGKYHYQLGNKFKLEQLSIFENKISPFEFIGDVLTILKS